MLIFVYYYLILYGVRLSIFKCCTLKNEKGSVLKVKIASEIILQSICYAQENSSTLLTGYCFYPIAQLLMKRSAAAISLLQKIETIVNNLRFLSKEFKKNVNHPKNVAKTENKKLHNSLAP